MSDTAPVFDAFAFLATLREVAEAPPAACPAPVGFSDPSGSRPDPSGREPAPHEAFRSFRRISPSRGVQPAPEPPAPPLPWRRLPFGPERGAAFAFARQQPGACRTCAGRSWWRHPDGTPCCTVCHPSPHPPTP